MTTGSIPGVLPLHPFVVGLTQSSRGVVQLTATAAGHAAWQCTGWLVTDSLVVTAFTPETAHDRESWEWMVSSPDLPAHTRITALPAPSFASSPHATDVPVVHTALLRLDPPAPERALRLNTTPTSSEIAILQYSAILGQLALSAGRVVTTDQFVLTHDANSDVGSLGSPVLDSHSWEVIGMHHSGRTNSSPSSRTGYALPLTAIVEALKACPEWAEIARHQQIADSSFHTSLSSSNGDSSLAPPPDPRQPGLADLLPAAVLWSFPREGLPHAAHVRSLVIDPSAPRWILKPAERIRLLQQVGPNALPALRKARAASQSLHEAGDPFSNASRSKEQAVLDRLLKGPPFEIQLIDELDLPYWLQAVRWFAGIIPGLPPASEIQHALEQRRQRSRLLRMTGQDFQGRETELQKLSTWQQRDKTGPMIITGIGGIGKSALVAHFALQQPPAAVIMWLDFDRPDLAPDDAVSVLRVISDQLSSQHPLAQRPAISPENWEKDAVTIAHHLAPLSHAILILDGFEVAQHSRQHQEIWAVLQHFTNYAPRLRIIISGRAPVTGHSSLGGDAQHLHLIGLSEPQAAAWLRQHRITGRERVQKVVHLCKGIPLMLKSVFYLVEQEGLSALDEVLAQPGNPLMRGFLYDRILNRVIDPGLKELARDALVLRRVTAPLVAGVLYDSLPTDMDATSGVDRLQHELALVCGPGEEALLILGTETGALHLRPEVRAATLKFLESLEPARVKLVDQRAAIWYSQHAGGDPALIAEQVYHLLRLDRVNDARPLWKPELFLHLQDAATDLPESAGSARKWLEEQLTGPRNVTQFTGLWEQDALSRIHDALRRDHGRLVVEILREQKGRTPESPLVFYDAWTLWQDKNLSGALNVLSAASSNDLSIRKQRDVLRTLVLRDLGKLPEARQILIALIEQLPSPPTNPLSSTGPGFVAGSAPTEHLALHAGLIRLLVDVEAESTLVDRPQVLYDPAQRMALNHGDAILPALAEQLLPLDPQVVSSGFRQVPSSQKQVTSFLDYYQE